MICSSSSSYPLTLRDRDSPQQTLRRTSWEMGSTSPAMAWMSRPASQFGSPTWTAEGNGEQAPIRAAAQKAAVRLLQTRRGLLPDGTDRKGADFPQQIRLGTHPPDLWYRWPYLESQRDCVLKRENWIRMSGLYFLSPSGHLLWRFWFVFVFCFFFKLGRHDYTLDTGLQETCFVEPVALCLKILPMLVHAGLHVMRPRQARLLVLHTKRILWTAVALCTQRLSFILYKKKEYRFICVCMCVLRWKQLILDTATTEDTKEVKNIKNVTPKDNHWKYLKECLPELSVF